MCVPEKDKDSEDSSDTAGDNSTHSGDVFSSLSRGSVGRSLAGKESMQASLLPPDNHDISQGIVTGLDNLPKLNSVPKADSSVETLVKGRSSQDA